MDYSVLIGELTGSYARQVEWYNQLKITVQKILGQIAVSRGTMTGVMGLFEEKKRLLENIERERAQSKGNTELWVQVKKELAGSESAGRLDSILADTEKAIREFLETEEQLKKYLEHYMTGKGNTSKQ